MRLARFVALATLAPAFLAMPLTTEAQVSGRVPRVGYLGFEPWPGPQPFERALKDLVWEDGRNIVLEMQCNLLWTRRECRRSPRSSFDSTST